MFVQFLDSLFQLLNQFPSAFEYNQEALVFLGDHLHSCLFGNFLGNSDKQRHSELLVMETTRSIWSHILGVSRFSNSKFTPFLQPIWPSTGITKCVLWERFHLRWDIDSHPNRFSGEEWHDDWLELIHFCVDCRAAAT